MEELNLIIQDFEETCSTLAITHDSPSKDGIKEKFEEYHQAKLKLLGIAVVVGQSEQLADKGRYCNDCGDYVGKGCDNSDCKDFKG